MSWQFARCLDLQHWRPRPPWAHPSRSRGGGRETERERGGVEGGWRTWILASRFHSRAWYLTNAAKTRDPSAETRVPHPPSSICQWAPKRDGYAAVVTLACRSTGSNRTLSNNMVVLSSSRGRQNQKRLFYNRREGRSEGRTETHTVVLKCLAKFLWRGENNSRRVIGPNLHIIGDFLSVSLLWKKEEEKCMTSSAHVFFFLSLRHPSIACDMFR